ncbi:hypothetical protein [Microbispora catharanthi]|uniref:Uncharacterized protein n=1 Tax=Microbispora catharanthi TaxID=1712871 RepID=A0A5N6C1M5_9ACTN|nr:hypothetical protein [Microbispora catharanthi]KAB8186589.1 hypothetical protein FH610_007330 [Microbispora catharanthi]
MWKKTSFAAVAAVAALSVVPAAPANAAVTVKIYQGYGAYLTESDHAFQCPTNEVLIGREHYGDENGITGYTCGRVYIDGEQITVMKFPLGDAMKESDSFFSAPENNAIVGRRHKGDENGTTTYYYGTLFWKGRVVRLTSRGWTIPLVESHHASMAGAVEVMTGRRHSGDENGDTAYEYGTVTLDG